MSAASAVIEDAYAVQYTQFLLANRRFLAFGFLLPFFFRLSARPSSSAFSAPSCAPISISMAFMTGAGLTAGTGLTLLGALWAELYGVLHPGSIRSFVWALVVFASAIAPALFGYLMDAGVRVESIAGVCVIAAVGAALLAGGSRLPKRWTHGI